MVHIDDATRAAEVRRLAVASAQSEGLGRQASEEVAIIATEMATNLLKHAHAGEIHITRLSPASEPGVEILSIDRGPGIENLEECIVDGFSSVGTAGTGLGAISRLADVFDAFSQPGRGSVMVARKFLHGPQARSQAWTFGAVKAPYPGEVGCGDNWSVLRTESVISMILADGLGHGVLATDASTAAITEFQSGRAESATAMLENVHLALRSTRGAAVAIARIEPETGTIRFAGLGNISGVLLGPARAQFMVSHNGTAGLEARRYQEFTYQFPVDGVIVMHSDGLNTNWSTSAYPGLLRRHPSVIAGILYRDAARGRDDVCVVVGRYIPV